MCDDFVRECVLLLLFLGEYNIHINNTYLLSGCDHVDGRGGRGERKNNDDDTEMKMIMTLTMII